MQLSDIYYRYVPYPRCKLCGKISYPSQERAMYASLVVDIILGCKLKAYRTQKCFYYIPNMETWHISSNVSRADRKRIGTVIDEKEQKRRNEENRRGKARKLR